MTSDNPSQPGHPAELRYEPNDETIRVWCCQTKVTMPHTPGCTFQAIDGQANRIGHELFLRDLRHLLNAHGWDSRLNVADNLLADWVLGELQGLAWVVGSANLTPGPRDIPFASKAYDFPYKKRPQLQDIPMENDSGSVEPEFKNQAIDAKVAPCMCGDVQLGVGQMVLLVGTVRHRRRMPCYGISSLDA